MPGSPVRTAYVGTPPSARATSPIRAASSASRPTIGQGATCSAAGWGCGSGSGVGSGAGEVADAGPGCRPVEVGVLAQHRGLQRTQLGRRLETQLLVEHLADLAEHVEGVGLSPGPSQSEGTQRPQALPQRVRRRQCLQLRDHGRVPAERQSGDGPVLERDQPQLLEPGPLGDRGRGVPELGVRRPPPERERPVEVGRAPAQLVGVQDRRTPPGQRLEAAVGGHDRLLEAVHVHVVVRHPQRVAGRHRDQHRRRRAALALGLHHPAQLRDVGLQGRGHPGRRGVLPQQVDDRVDRDRPAARQRERGDQGALLRSAEIHRLGGPGDLDRTEDGDLHADSLGSTATAERAPSRLQSRLQVAGAMVIPPITPHQESPP